MLIWTTLYRDKLNALASRVGATGTCGIYKITHIDSGLSYIGQAKDIKERWVKEVKEALGIDAPSTNQRCKFMREHGVDNFTFEVLEKCAETELNEKERFYIDLYQAYEFGMNATRGNKK
jgi:group I intron endonuclease